MNKTYCTLLLALALSGASAGQIETLGGDELTAASKQPQHLQIMEVKGGIARGFKEQPPMVPHQVDKYEVDLKVNGCLKCHSPDTYEKEKAPKIGDSHFLDRDGKKLSQVSQRRYFCTQCHVPQAVVDPLVENRFQGRK